MTPAIVDDMTDGQYLRTLGVHPGRPVCEPFDGAYLFEVPPLTDGGVADHPYVPTSEINVKRDRHFIVLACDRHEHHRGHRAFVTQVLRHGVPDLVCFAQFTHPQQGWSAYHYGPAWAEETA